MNNSRKGLGVWQLMIIKTFRSVHERIGHVKINESREHFQTIQYCGRGKVNNQYTVDPFQVCVRVTISMFNAPVRYSDCIMVCTVLVSWCLYHGVYAICIIVCMVFVSRCVWCLYHDV